MGLKEPEPTNNKRWSHPPKKKWIHCYMSVGEEKSSEASELKSGLVIRGSSDPIQVPYAPSHNHVSSVCPIDRRGISLPPVSLSSICYEKIPSDDLRHTHRRRAHQSLSPYSPSANGRGSPHLTASYSISPPLLPSLKPALESSSFGLVSAFKAEPLDIATRGLVNAFKAEPLDINSRGMVSGFNAESLDVVSRGIVSGFKTEPVDVSSRSLSVDSTTTATTTTPVSHLSPESPGARLTNNGFLRPNGLAKPLSPLSREYEDQFGKDDPKKRSGSTPSREVHNKLEKNRRAHLKECFETLRRQLPSMEDKKISNQTILKAAHRYIQNLKRKEREFEHEMERLARQKIAHQQQLASLKKELQAKWDHIDFSAILPDMASLEQHREKETKSTTTASEQPDFEEDSHDSSGHSNSLTLTSSPELKTSFNSQPVDLTPSVSSTECASYNSSVREIYQDPNQPLNLSTNTLDVQKSPHRHPSPVRSPQQQRVNGEWPVRRNSHYTTTPYSNEEKISATKPHMMGRVHTPGNTVQMSKLSPSSSNLSVNISRTSVSSFSTNVPHHSPVNVKGCAVSSTVSPSSNVNNTSVTHISHLVKSGTAISHLSSIAKVVTTFPNLSTLPQTGTTVTHIPHNTLGSNVGHIHTITSAPSSVSHPHIIHQEPSNIQAIPTTVAIGTNLTHVPHLATVGTTVTRVSTASVVSSTNSSVNAGSQEHSLPIVGGNGISLPAHLVASGVHLSGTSGTLLGQPAIQVITPEGYKLLPAEHGPNGAKPLAITLAHPGLEHLSAGEDGKPGQVMVAVSKNGLSALHLTMPASARTITNHLGNSVPVTSVPLNLTVGSSGTVKVTQAGSTTSLLPSYLPLTHANGITQLVQGMSLVGPLVVSQSQRGVMVPANAAGGKGIKTQGVTAGGSMPLVPAQYASTIAGGLVNSVVVVSAPTVVGPTCQPSAISTTIGMPTAKH